MKEAFKLTPTGKPWKPHAKTLELIHLGEEIAQGLLLDGYSLTLRQLYYQLVQLNIIVNKQTEYKRLGEILNDARLGGLFDWSLIEDRTRNLRGINHRVDPADILHDAAGTFRLNKWTSQRFRPEVWVEKDALVQVVEKACTPLDVDYFSCRGYTSSSEIHGCSKRFLDYIEAGQTPVIIHLGDHDPSGKDMTRDILDRVNMMLRPYTDIEVDIERIALNMDQIRKYNPPPNPAKQTDSRYKEYKAKFGKDCWELDALNVRVLDKLITDKVKDYMDDDQWAIDVATEDEHRASLKACANRWGDVKKFLSKPPKAPRKPRAKKAKKKTKLK